MNHVKVRLVVDMIVWVLVILSFAVAIDDLNSSSDGLHVLRGCFLFSTTFLAEGIGYLVTLGGLYKRQFLINTIAFFIGASAAVLTFVFMITGANVNSVWKWIIILLMTVYPVKKSFLCVIDIGNWLKIYG